MTYDCVSLFSGAMGLDLGLERVGIRTVLCAESDPTCRQTIALNRPKIKVLEDVREVGSGTANRNPFLVAAGFPCQPFSSAGKRASFSDPRGLLAFEFGRVVKDLQPRFFVAENVKGLASATVPWAEGKTALQEILDNFESLGYKTVHGLLMAANYGVPQFRERIIIIGSRDGEDVFLPFPTHFPRHQSTESRWKTLRDAIWLMKYQRPCGDEFAKFPESRLKFLRLVPPGGNWKTLPREMQKQAMGGAFESEGGKMGFFRRLSWDAPCPTLTTCPTQKATMLCHPEEDRPLSVSEYAAIQQFPKEPPDAPHFDHSEEGWRFVGTMADKYRQIGNAVPVGLGQAIGLAILSASVGYRGVESKRFGPRSQVRPSLSSEAPTPASVPWS